MRRCSSWPWGCEPSCLGILILAVGCSGPRGDARTELHRLSQAMRTHVEQFDRYPETINPDAPSGPANLRYRSKRGVELRILPRKSGYHATARKRHWVCSMSGDSEVPTCYPVNGTP